MVGQQMDINQMLLFYIQLFNVTQEGPTKQ